MDEHLDMSNSDKDLDQESSTSVSCESEFTLGDSNLDLALGKPSEKNWIFYDIVSKGG